MRHKGDGSLFWNQDKEKESLVLSPDDMYTRERESAYKGGSEVKTLRSIGVLSHNCRSPARGHRMTGQTISHYRICKSSAKAEWELCMKQKISSLGVT